VIIVIEMLPDIPDMLDMALERQPQKNQQQRFSDSVF
jgi:hypothetical protein